MDATSQASFDTVMAFMGLMGGPAEAAIAGLAFAIIAAIAIFLVWRKPAVA